MIGFVWVVLGYSLGCGERVGVNMVGLGWSGFVRVWISLGWSELIWVGFACSGLVWVSLSWSGLLWVGLGESVDSGGCPGLFGLICLGLLISPRFC